MTKHEAILRGMELLALRGPTGLGAEMERAACEPLERAGFRRNEFTERAWLAIAAAKELEAVPLRFAEGRWDLISPATP